MEISVADIGVETDLEGFAFGLVRLQAAVIGSSSADLISDLGPALASASPDRKAQVRDMLRHGKYKPTGRGKPACEYLLKAAQEERFPSINNLVDALNLVSLKSQLPISIIDTDLAQADRFRIRRGHEEESFIFNAGGQTIGLQDLLLVSSLPEDLACANPVKDSMRTKLTENSTNTLSIIYAPAALRSEVHQATKDLEDLYLRSAGPSAVAQSAVLA